METIYQRENGNTEEWIYVDDDGSVVHRSENAGWVMVRKGTNPRETRYTPEEAKAKWPNFAAQIDAALANLAK